MIKGITIVRQIAARAAYEKLDGFFSVLGLEAGHGWNQDESQSVSFLAPLGNLEFAFGRAITPAEILIEVAGLDAIEGLVRAWMVEAWGEEETARKLTAVSDTHWKSRSFSVEPVPGHAFAFWEWSDPLKGRPLALEGDLSAQGMRFAVVVSRWNGVITDRLLQGAMDGLLRSGALRQDIQVIRVPGAWEIPAAARQAATLGRVDAVITLGAVLRGETTHYEFLSNEVMRGIGQSQQETGIPHALGVLTCETLEQALNRAGVKAGNKGFEAAIASIEMASLQRKIRGESGGSTASAQPGAEAGTRPGTPPGIHPG